MAVAMKLLSLSVLTTLILMSSGMSVRKARDVSNMIDASKYLRQFGYMNGMESTDFNEDDTETALLRFQQTFNLPTTGTLNEETLEKMRQPRCAVEDTGIIASGRSRTRRYALQGSAWPKLDLTYKITQYTDDLTHGEIDDVVRRSFKAWSDVTPLKFSSSDSNSSNILISFVSGAHGDGYPFDGQGGTLAHAFFPGFGGNAHFDDSERWTIGTHEGINFFQVCVHEFGHSLGLSHSNVKNAIMEPYYPGYQPGRSLHQDDVDGIQAIYGSPTTTPGDACSVEKWDAVATVENGDTHFFAGQHYYKLSTNLEEARTPRLIKDDWEGLDENVDAAVTLAQGLTFIFKGENFYLFRGQQSFDNRVRKISLYLQNFPDNVDAAFAWPGNRTMHVAKGLEYLNTRDESGVLTQAFPGAPATVDAVNRTPEGNLHFFVGKLYYVFGKDQNRVISGPLSVGQDYFGCHDNTLNVPDEGIDNTP